MPSSGLSVKLGIVAAQVVVGKARRQCQFVALHGEVSSSGFGSSAQSVSSRCRQSSASPRVAGRAWMPRAWRSSSLRPCGSTSARRAAAGVVRCPGGRRSAPRPSPGADRRWRPSAGIPGCTACPAACRRRSPPDRCAAPLRGCAVPGRRRRRSSGGVSGAGRRRRGAVSAHSAGRCASTPAAQCSPSSERSLGRPGSYSSGLPSACCRLRCRCTVGHRAGCRQRCGSRYAGPSAAPLRE